MKIADVFFRALLDDSTLKVDAVKVGNKAGDTMGRSMSERIKANLGSALSRGALAAFGGMAAVATKGLLQLEDIQARLQAETGATAEEAEKAGKAINQIAGRNLQPLSQVGDAFIEVSKQMQLTGDAAAAMTEEILKFSTATGTDAVENVKHLDNVLDAWNLTAADAQSLMDKLVVGQQRFGGSVSANITALKDYAPQLQALNASVDDALGLLNLFAASGLDAASATRALNTAVKNIQPGQSLNDLIAKLVAIPNATDRAKEAIRIFGARGGVALANALRPGITGLQDFQISASDAAGATDRAAGVIENTLGARFQLAMKAAGAAVIGFGQSFGPAVTGVASLGAILASSGLGGKLLSAFSGLGAIVRDAAAKAGATIAGYFVAGFGIAEKIAKAALQGVTAIAERAGIKAVAAKAGSQIGAIFAAAMKLAEKVGAAAVDAFLKLPFIPKLRAAVLAAGITLGTLEGTAIGTAAGAAAALAVAGIVVSIPLLLIPQIPDIQKWLNEHNPFTSQAGKDAVTGFTNHMNDVANGAGQDAGKALTDGMKTGALDTAQDAGIGVATAYGDAIKAGIKAQQDPVSKTVEGWIAQMGVNWQKVAHAQGNLNGAALAQGIRDKRDAVDKSWQDLLDVIKNSITPTRERSKLLGELVSTTLAKALRDKRPDVRDQANATKQTIIDRLDELKANAHNIGAKGMAELRLGMKSKDADIRAESTAIFHAATSSTKKLPATGTAEGGGFADNIASSISGRIWKGALAAYNLVADILKFTNRLPGPDYSPGPRPVPRATGGSARAGMPYIVGDRYKPELFVPETNGRILPDVPQTGAGPITIGAINLYGVGSDVSPTAAKRFGQQIVDEMGKTFRQQGARIGLHPAVVP